MSTPQKFSAIIVDLLIQVGLYFQVSTPVANNHRIDTPEAGFSTPVATNTNSSNSPGSASSPGESYATSPAGIRCRVVSSPNGSVLLPVPALSPWGPELRSRLTQPTVTVRAQKEALTAVSLGSVGGGTVYCAGHGAGLKVPPLLPPVG